MTETEEKRQEIGKQIRERWEIKEKSEEKGNLGERVLKRVENREKKEERGKEIKERG